MRDRRMKILLHRFKVLIAPECLDQHLLQHASIFAGCYVTENVSGAPRRPGVGGKLNRRIAEDLYWAKYPYRQIGDWGGWFQLRLDARRPHFHLQFLAQIQGQPIRDIVMSEYHRISPDLAPQPVLVIEPIRKIQSPPYGLDHRVRVSLSEVRLCKEHRCQSFVVVVIMAVEIIKQFAEVHVLTFEFAFRKIKLIETQTRGADPVFVSL